MICFERLKATPEFADLPFDDLMDPARFVGRAPEQVDAFVAAEVDPIRSRYAKNLHSKADLRV